MALARYEGVAQDSAGNVIPNATVEVRRDQAGRPVVPLFSDRNGTVPMGNPITTNERGQFAFHAPGGVYYIRVFTGPSQAPFQEYTRRYQAVGTAAERDVEELASSLNSGMGIFGTFDGLELFTPEATNVGARVINDPDPSLNGDYLYEGSVWVKQRNLPDTLARMEVTGGTPNAIEASITEGIDPAAVVMLLLTPEANNTGPVKVNGIDLLAFDGSQLEEGWLVANVPVFLFVNDDGDYQLTSDVRYQIIAGEVIEARTEVLAARDKAAEWAENPVDDPVETGLFSAKHHASKAAGSASAANESAGAAASSATEAWAAKDAAEALYGDLAAIDEAKVAAEASSILSSQARDIAVAAAEASGSVAFFDTKAAATSALADLPDQQVVEVFADETQGGLRSRYRKQSSALALKVIFGDAEVPAQSVGMVIYTVLRSTITTSGYIAGGDGGSARYKRVSSEPSHPGKLQSADGTWWELAETEPNVRMFGAKPDDATDSGPALLNAFNFVKYIMGLFVGGTPNPTYPRGCELYVPPGVYRSSVTLPLFSRLKLIGDTVGRAPLAAIRYTGSTYLFDYQEASGNTVELMVLHGIAFVGPANCEANVVKSVAPSFVNAFRFCTIEQCSFSNWQPFEFGILASTFSQNEFLRMPYGNVVIHGSDSLVEGNFFNGDDVSGVTVANKFFKYCVDTSTFNNSRFRDNYITAGPLTGNPVRMQAMRLYQSYDDDIEDNWFDLTDGPGLVIQDSNAIRISGGRFAKIGLNPLTVDFSGNNVGDRWKSVILFLGVTSEISLEGHRFAQSDASIVPYRWDSGTHAGSFRIGRALYDRHTPPFPGLMTGSASNNSNIYMDEYAQKAFPYRSDTAPSNLPVVMEQLLQLSSASPSNYQPFLPPAKVGRRVKIWNANGAYFISGIVRSGDTFRGQPGMVRIRLLPADIGKWVDLTCLTDGVWEVTSNGTPAYFAS